MIAEEMKEYCYSFEEMLEILADSEGKPMAASTLRRKIHTRDPSVPSAVSPRRGVYWFPKDLVQDWMRALPQIGASNAS